MGNKGKKVSVLASATADSAPRTVLLPRYLVWMKSYLFVYVSLSAVCTLSRRCSSVLHRIPACVHIALSVPPTCMHPRRAISSHMCIRPPKANPIRRLATTRSPLRFLLRCTLIAFNISTTTTHAFFSPSSFSFTCYHPHRCIVRRFLYFLEISRRNLDIFL